MKKYGLLGGKLGHSLSPVIHESFFKHIGLDGSYELLETELVALPQRMEQLASEFVGVNVTIPHKLNVIPFLDGVAQEAQAIGAVNDHLTFFLFGKQHRQCYQYQKYNLREIFQQYPSVYQFWDLRRR